MILKTRDIEKVTEGDYRIDTKFAFFPVWIKDKKIWLQKYQIFYQYIKRDRYIGYPFFLKVNCCSWDEIDRKIL